MNKLNPFSDITTDIIIRARESFGAPVYLYDEALIARKCKEAADMPCAYGLSVRYAMKANPSRALLRIIDSQGLLIDASSFNEAKRANMAGIDCGRIMLTTQEVPEGGHRRELEGMLLKGLRYNVCSLRQLHMIADFAREHGLELSMRVHPGKGSGESASRNTGDQYSCFGVHLSDVAEALRFAAEKSVKFTQLHIHIGSGADPELWRQNIDLELGIAEQYFPDAETISFGGGLKEARMPDEISADIHALGDYAKTRVEEFFRRTGRKLKTEIEPGTFIMANAGYLITKVMDKKRTGADGMSFVLANAGVEANARPLMYAARHPFYIISRKGELLSSEFDAPESTGYSAVVVGRCCETGDSQCLDGNEKNSPRAMAEPEIGDIVVIGGVGAYSSSISPFNYNSHTQLPEALFTRDGQLRLIRKRETLEQIVENEL